MTIFKLINYTLFVAILSKVFRLSKVSWLFLFKIFFINLLFYLMGKYAKKIGIFLFETKSKN